MSLSYNGDSGGYDVVGPQLSCIPVQDLLGIRKYSSGATGLRSMNKKPSCHAINSGEKDSPKIKRGFLKIQAKIKKILKKTNPDYKKKKLKAYC